MCLPLSLPLDIFLTRAETPRSPNCTSAPDCTVSREPCCGAAAGCDLLPLTEAGSKAPAQRVVTMNKAKTFLIFPPGYLVVVREGVPGGASFGCRTNRGVAIKPSTYY